MKTLIAVNLCACASSLLAQCATTFSHTEKIGVVAEKFDCLVQENAKLRQELAKAREPGQLQIRVNSSPFFRKSTFSTDTCKDRAVESALKRGGAVVRRGNEWIDLQIGDKAVTVICDTVFGKAYIASTDAAVQDITLAYVIVSGTRSNELWDFCTLLSSEIFSGVN